MLSLAVAKSTATKLAESDRKCDNKKIKEDKRFTIRSPSQRLRARG